MMFPFQSKPESSAPFEHIFLEYYSRLLEWALQLARGDQFEAEDLVQELYIRFVRLGTAPEHVESVENYLFSVLRNLHYSRVRSARTSALDDLSIVDYDSAERGLRSVDRNGLLFIRADLHRICDYLCDRKNSSRSASIFILRYFLGYFPNEVMKVAQSSRGAVDKAIRLVRRETHLHLTRPSTLRRMGADRTSREKKSLVGDDPQSLFLALHSKIFKSCPGECLGPASLESKYAQPDQCFTTEEFAHLVSCVTCLDQANQILKLPLLAERSPDETIGRDTPHGPGSSGGQAPTLLPRTSSRKKEETEKRRKRLQRSAQEANQHRPRRLSIAVDGDVRASHKVTSQFSELRVELRPMETPAFIEVLSEQRVCLAFVPVRTPVPEGGLDQTEEIEFSDDRSMRVVISFAAESPGIQVVYRDPLIASDTELEEEGSLEMLALPMRKAVGISNNSWRVTIANFLAPLRHLPSQMMNPSLAGAMLFALCSILCFIYWTRSGPAISAGTILSRAEQTEASVADVGHPKVVYQKVRIVGSGHTMERAIYRDPQKKRRLKQQHLNPDDQWLKNKLSMAGVNWDEPLSASNYRQWHDRLPERLDAVTRAGSNLITLTTSTEANGPVFKESITIRESDFHPVGRTIELRDVGEVEIAELSYDVMPWGAVNQDWFEPLLGESLVDPARAHPTLSKILPRALSESELDAAELSVRVALNHLDADAGEPILVSRSTSGIQVKGIVENNQRKLQLEARLQLLPHVHPSLMSVEELGKHPNFGLSPKGVPIQAYSVEAQPSPLEQYLRENRLPLDQLETITQGLLDQSFRMKQAEVHLTELHRRFKEANQLPIDQQNQLTELSRNYLNQIQAGLDANRRTFLSIGLDGTEEVPSSLASNSPVEDISHQVRRYQEFCQQLITSGTGTPISAVVVADKLRTSSLLIRSRVAQMQASLSTANN
jgi:DNA-directed RNA polymerase specialized sigma24 family protein